MIGRKEKRFGNAANDQTTFLVDTFLQPLVDDLRTLALEGVTAVRWVGENLVPFTMRAHLLVVIGDMPAISKVSCHCPVLKCPKLRERTLPKLMHFKGINSKAPCRCCTHRSTPTTHKKKVTYYPSIANSEEEADIARYLNLPLREDVETRRTATWIDRCQNNPAKKHVQQETGINGSVSKFLLLPTHSVPDAD